jgi:hypothetical protein
MKTILPKEDLADRDRVLCQIGTLRAVSGLSKTTARNEKLAVCSRRPSHSGYMILT